MSANVNDFVMNNLIYCQDTHSFVHRLYDNFKANMPENHRDAQQIAWKIVEQMNLEEKPMNKEHNLSLDEIREELATVKEYVDAKANNTTIDAEKSQFAVLSKHIFNLIVVCETMQKQQ